MTLELTISQNQTAISESCNNVAEIQANIQFLNIIKGKKGDKGDTPYIGLNGNWWVSGEDTGTPATGDAGVGISNCELVSTVGKVKTYRITFSNSTTFEYTLEDGSDGREVLIQNNGTYIQWQYEGDVSWNNIIEVSTLKGDTGESIELQVNATHIQWRVVGDLTWINLISLEDLKGDKGDTGAGVPIGGTTSQKLVKKSNTDYDTEWTDDLGEANIIEEVQANGTPLTVTNKSVNVVIPTQASDIGAEPANSNIQQHISDETIHHTIEELDELYESKNSNIQEHIADTDIHVTTTDKSNWDAKADLDEVLKLDQTTPQTIQGLLQNKSTAALESAPLSNELLTSENWTTTDWTGDFTAGFTHTTGNVTPLTNTLAALNNTLYQIAFTVTNRTAGSINITFGGVATGAVTSSGAIGNRTASTGTLSIVPTTDFNGTIVISIKRIVGVYNPTYQILDSTGVSTIEIRSSLNTLNNTFIGKGAGSSNTTGYQNSAQGTYTLRNNTTGSYNSAQGYAALQNNTTGYQNSAQGVYALYSNTTGSYNSAQGYAALYSNTTGYQNSAQGYAALYSNTTGYNNTAQGYAALQNNTTGYQNSAQGTYTLRNNTTGYNNTAQGYAALYSNTTGYQNSAQGYAALYSNTTGSYNSAQGYAALQNNTTGYNNTAQGYAALQNNTTGYNNTAQGYAALQNNTTGYQNSAQGVYAGRFLADGVTANQTSNNSVFLGYNTKSKQAGQTNEIVIGANAIGNGSNTVTIGHTNVTDTYLRGKGHFTGSVQIGDDTAPASVANEFAIRGRKGINGNIGFSVTEMCMPTNVGTWNWVEIVRNEWIIP